MNITTFYLIFGIIFSILIIILILWYFLNIRKKKNQSKKDDQFQKNKNFFKEHKNFIFNTKINNQKFNSGFLIATGKANKNNKKIFNPKNKYLAQTDVEGYLIPKAHMLCLGSSGSGKTDTILIPNIILNSISNDAPNGLIFDPKGEIYNVVAPWLKANGYKIILINLTETTQSHCWNPFQYAIDLANNHIKFLFLINQLEKNEKQINSIFYSLKQSKYNEAYTSIENTTRILISSVDKEQNIWNQNSKELFALTAKILLNYLIDKSLQELKDFKIDKELNENEYQTLIFSNEKINSIIANNLKNLNYKNIIRWIGETSKKEWLIYLQEKNLNENLGIFKSTDDQYASFIMNVTGGTSSLNEPAFNDIISKSDFSYEDLINKKIMIFINIPSNIETRKSLAVILTNQIFDFLENKAKENKTKKLNKPFYFYLEELGNLPQINCVKSIITLGRGMNIFGYLFVQSLQQISEKWSKDIIPQIWDSTMYKIFLLVQYPDVAKTICDMFGSRQVRNEDGNLVSEKLIEPSELLKIKQGQCLIIEQRKSPIYLNLASIKNYKILSNFETKKYGDWFLTNEDFYSEKREQDIQIITNNINPDNLNNIIHEYIYNDWLIEIINKNEKWKKSIEDKRNYSNESTKEIFTIEIFNAILEKELSLYLNSKNNIDGEICNKIFLSLKNLIDNKFDSNKEIINNELKNKENLDIKEMLNELIEIKNKEVNFQKQNDKINRNLMQKKYRKLEKKILLNYENINGIKADIKEIKSKYNYL